MFKNLTIPLLTGTLAVSVIINILLVKRLKSPTTAQPLESIDWFFSVSQQDDVTEEEVNAILAPILQEIEEKRNQENIVNDFEKDLKNLSNLITNIFCFG